MMNLRRMIYKRVFGIWWMHNCQNINEEKSSYFLAGFCQQSPEVRSHDELCEWGFRLFPRLCQPVATTKTRKVPHWRQYIFTDYFSNSKSNFCWIFGYTRPSSQAKMATDPLIPSSKMKPQSHPPMPATTQTTLGEKQGFQTGLILKNNA